MAVRVGVGLGGFGFEDRRGWFRYVERLEEAGVDSFWQTDRLVSKEPYLESMAAMAALAGATERIKFGMNAVVVGFRDPLVLAKQCATIDYLSGGRLLPVFGVGADHAPEWKATGKDKAHRGAKANEALTLMARLWSEESVDFEGEFFRYRGARIEPRPIQQPLPLWIGGASPAAQRRTARLGTGWLAGITPVGGVASVIQGIHAECERIGRRLDPEHFGATIPFHFGEPTGELGARFARAAGTDDPSEIVAIGDATTLVERVRAYLEAGASKFVMLPLARTEKQILEQTERLLEEVIPVVEAPDFRSRAAG